MKNICVKSRFGNDNMREIEYDPDLGIETLVFQLISVHFSESFDGVTSLILLDFSGREIIDSDDLADIVKPIPCDHTFVEVNLVF